MDIGIVLPLAVLPGGSDPDMGALPDTVEDFDFGNVSLDVVGILIVRSELDTGQRVMEEDGNPLPGLFPGDGAAGDQDFLLVRGIQRYGIVEIDEATTAAHAVRGHSPGHAGDHLRLAEEEIEHVVVLVDIVLKMTLPNVHVPEEIAVRDHRGRGNRIPLGGIGRAVEIGIHGGKVLRVHRRSPRLGGGDGAEFRDGFLQEEVVALDRIAHGDAGPPDRNGRTGTGLATDQRESDGFIVDHLGSCIFLLAAGCEQNRDNTRRQR